MYFERLSPVNRDETSIFLDDTGRMTVEQKGAQRDIVKVNCFEQLRITLVLACTLSGIMLRQFIIFKGNEGKNVHRKLQQHNRVKCKQVNISLNPAAWMNRELMVTWFNSTIKKHPFY